MINGVIYGATLWEMYALDATTVLTKWTYEIRTVLSGPPTITGGLVYLNESDGPIDALDMATGALKWHYLSNSSSGLGTALTIVDGVGYAAWENAVVALDAASGAVKWTYPFTLDGIGPVAVTGGVVYASADKSYALDAATGSLRWQYPATPNGNDALQIANGVIYMSANDNNVYALDATTGAVRWQYTRPAASANGSGLPSLSVVK